MKLRPYQAEALANIRKELAAGRDTVAVLPTGAGKTVLFSEAIRTEPGASVAIAHRQELVTQISLALARDGVEHRIVGPKSVVKLAVRMHREELGRDYINPTAQCAAIGVDTLLRRAERPEVAQWLRSVRLVVMDECHHVLRGNKWGKALELFTNARTLGVTATPTRADGKGLGAHADGVFSSMVVGPSMRQLIDAGYLTDYRIFCPPSDLDRASLATGSTGDFTASSMATAVRRSHITGDVVEHYLRIARGKLGVTFVPNVETAHEVADRFNAAGVPAAALSAKTPDAERVATLGKFRRRELLQLVNVDLFGEGFDLPAIEVCSMARPTQSYSLYVQQFGRALRLMDGKHEAVIIDHVGNVVHHGLPDAPREWTLDAREKRSSGPSDAIPLRACVACFLPYERSKPECPMCGHRPEPAERSGPEHVDGDLFELDPEVLARMRGEVEKVDGAPQVAHIPLIGQKAAYKRHIERQHGQAVLREVMAHWAGAERAAGRSDAEILRRFYLRFGVDVMTAKTLKPKEAGALAARIVNGN